MRNERWVSGPGLPDFFIAGPPKSASTSLAMLLGSHPDVFVPTVKEPKFFLVEGRPPRSGGPNDNQAYGNYVWSSDAHRRLYRNASSSVLRADCTPFYLRFAHRKMHRLTPNARIVAVLRDPVRRAFSQWSYMRYNGQEPVRDFVEACRMGEDRLARGWAPEWGYVEQGLYASHLEHLLEYFPREQILLLRFETLVHDPRSNLRQLAEFLGIDPAPMTDLPWENPTGGIDETVRGRMTEVFIRSGFKLRSLVPDRVRNPVAQAAYRRYRRPPSETPPPCISAAEVASLRDEFAADVQRLRTAYCFDNSGWLEGSSARDDAEDCAAR